MNRKDRRACAADRRAHFGKAYDMKVQDYLTENGKEFSVLEHPAAYTAQEVAAE